MKVLESLGLGFNTFAIGLIIVFVVLFIMIGMSKLLKPLAAGIQSVSVKKAEYKQRRQAEKAEARTEKAAAAVTPVQKEVQPEPVVSSVSAPAQQDDLELIAVLTAAVACAMGKEPGYVTIRSFRRIPSNGSAWSSTSKRENVLNHF